MADARQVREGNLESTVLGDLLANIVYMLHNCTTLVDACAVITRSLKQASGFSRVMIYKFHPYVALPPVPLLASPALLSSHRTISCQGQSWGGHRGGSRRGLGAIPAPALSSMWRWYVAMQLGRAFAVTAAVWPAGV